MAIVCLAKISPMNPATGSRVDLYVSSANDRNVTGLNGVVWEPAMTASPTLSVNLWQGDFKEPVDTGGASFAVHMGILKMTYANADTYNWAGAPVEVYAEEPGTAWPWTARYKGRVSNFSRRSEILSLNSSVQTEPFDKNILTTVYAGTGGAEGGADIKGRLKPLIVGWAKNVEPILIDTVNNIYQFSGYGVIEGVTSLYERAADFGASDGDFATYAALLAASIPAGRWATCLAAGMVRLGAPAAGVITGDIKGHKVGGSTPRLTGAVISAMATIAGVSASDIETTTLTALDSAVPYPINLVLTEQSNFREMAASLALACNWQSGITLQGKFFVLSVSLSGSEVITFNAQGRALPQVVSSDEQDVSVPYYKTIFGANRNWRVQTSDEIAFTADLIDRGTYSGAETYREGNIVTTPDGARWLYTNPTAGSGNAPPALPTTSNAYWSNMTDASPVAILGFLTNESHVVAADSSGVVSSFTGASGTFIVQENGKTLSSGVTFSLVSSSGVTVSINNSDGTYSATAMSASNGTALLRATYNGVIIDKIFSISKSVQGATGAPGSTGSPGSPGSPATSAYLTNETVQLFAYANGNVVSYGPATGSFKVFSGNTDVSASFSLHDVANPQALTMAYAGQTYSVTGGFDAGEDTASVTIRATGSGAYAGVTFDKVFSLSKAKGGYEIVGSLPSTNLFSGRVVFNEADDKLYRYTGSAWTSAVPAIDISGAIDYQQIGDGAVRVNHLLVQPNNLHPDPQFRDLSAWYQENESGTVGDGPLNGTGFAAGWYAEENASPPNAVRGTRYLVLWSGRPGMDNSARYTVYARIEMGNCIRPAAGAKYELKANIENGTNQWCAVLIQWVNLDNSAIISDTPLFVLAGETKIASVQGTAPSNAAYGRIVVINQGVVGGGPALSGAMTVTNISIRDTAGASMIVDGEIVAGKLAANAVLTDNLQAGAVTAAKISVTSLAAISATIGLLRTATSGARLEIESNQIRVYDDSNVLRMRLGVW